MTRLTFRQRLTAQWTLSFGVLLALVSTAIYVGARLYLYDELDAQLRTLAATEVASSTDGPNGIHLHAFPLEEADPLRFVDKFVQVLSPDGQIVLRTPGIDLATPLLAPERVAATLAGDSLMRSVSVDGRSARFTGLPAVTGDQSYVVIVGVFTDRLDASLAYLAWLLASIWLVGLALTGTLGVLLASHVLAPVARITSQAAAIARGQAVQRLGTPRVDDEIGQMTRLLNEMLDRLESAIDVNRRFAADASHELRGPLTAIRGEVDVALRRERTAQEYRETLRTVGDRADELTALIEDLTLLVRAREGRATTPTEATPLLPLLQASAERVADAARAREISLRLDAFPDLEVRANPALLAHVFTNLLRNAIEYNRPHGHVTVGGTLLADPDGRDQAVVRVTDSGIGVAPADRERIFERFYRVDASRSRQTGGTGLGLAICREVLGLFHGSVSVAGSSTRGTTMEVRLPGRMASSQTTTGPLAAPAGATVSV